MPDRAVYPLMVFLRGRGTTLIELMLSITLSLVLLALLSAIYLTTADLDERQAALSSLHDNSRLALHRLSAELQAAGFIGCPQLTADFPVGNTTSYLLSPYNQLELHQDAAGSAVVTVRHRSSSVNLLQLPMTEASVLVVSADFPVARDDILLISDCRHADIFQVAQVSREKGGQRLTAKRPLRYRYAENAEVGEFEMNTYFVEKTGLRDERGQLVYALYRHVLRGQKTAWVEGIQQLKIEEFRWGKTAESRGFSIMLAARQKMLHKTEYAFVALRNAA